MSVELFAIIGIVFIVLLLAIIFVIPSEKKIKKKKEKPQVDHSVDLRAWEGKIVRLEKRIEILHNEALKYQDKEKVNEKRLMVERVKVKKLQEKLTQERQWHEKEQAGIDKKGKEYQQLKKDLIESQEQFSTEHSANLRHEQKIKELERDNSALTDQRRKVESENSQLAAKLDSFKKDIAQLKRENILLNKKNDDVNWVTKTEYDRVAKKLKEKEKELERFTRENK